MIRSPTLARLKNASSRTAAIQGAQKLDSTPIDQRCKVTLLPCLTSDFQIDTSVDQMCSVYLTIGRTGDSDKYKTDVKKFKEELNRLGVNVHARQDLRPFFRVSDLNPVIQDALLPNVADKKKFLGYMVPAPTEAIAVAIFNIASSLFGPPLHMKDMNVTLTTAHIVELYAPWKAKDPSVTIVTVPPFDGRVKLDNQIKTEGFNFLAPNEGIRDLGLLNVLFDGFGVIWSDVTIEDETTSAYATTSAVETLKEFLTKLGVKSTTKSIDELLGTEQATNTAARLSVCTCECSVLLSNAA